MYVKLSRSTLEDSVIGIYATLSYLDKGFNYTGIAGFVSYRRGGNLTFRTMRLCMLN